MKRNDVFLEALNNTLKRQTRRLVGRPGAYFDDDQRFGGARIQPAFTNRYPQTEPRSAVLAEPSVPLHEKVTHCATLKTNIRTQGENCPVVARLGRGCCLRGRGYLDAGTPCCRRTVGLPPYLPKVGQHHTLYVSPATSTLDMGLSPSAPVICGQGHTALVDLLATLPQDMDGVGKKTHIRALVCRVLEAAEEVGDTTQAGDEAEQRAERVREAAA